LSQNFDAHGVLYFHIKDENILVVEGAGPWNIEVFTSLTNEQLTLIQSLHGSNWGVLAIVYGEAIHTPDASEMLEEIVRHDKTLGRVASAIIVKDSKTPIFSKDHIVSIYEAAGECVKCFEDEELAISWLKKQL
jgi:hypothetical protein